MRVLVVNAGSSSLKLAVVDGGHQVAATTVERWEGEDHLEPISSFVEDVDNLEAIGHRIVHGGPRLTESVRIDDDVLDYLDSIEDLAPLHNPRAVAGIRAVRQLLPGIPEVACFDTTFHAHLPAAARTYALPKAWNDRWGLRRYGFHGLSHAYAVRRGAELIDRNLADLRVVSCHLGAGASLAAVRGGTLGGHDHGLHAARGPGDGDQVRVGGPGPAPVAAGARRLGRRRLGPMPSSTRPGLKGLSGTSGDLRDVLAARTSGDAGRDAGVRRVRPSTPCARSARWRRAPPGSTCWSSPAGSASTSPEVRALWPKALGYLGVRLADDLNAGATSDADISDSRCPRAHRGRRSVRGERDRARDVSRDRRRSARRNPELSAVTAGRKQEPRPPGRLPVPPAPLRRIRAPSAKPGWPDGPRRR